MRDHMLAPEHGFWPSMPQSPAAATGLAHSASAANADNKVSRNISILPAAASHF
jgi:hypothetical protein